VLIAADPHEVDTIETARGVTVQSAACNARVRGAVIDKDRAKLAHENRSW